MKDGSLAPVVAGLAVGVAFVLLLGVSGSGAGHWLLWPPPLPDWSYYAPLIQLKITGLNETYEVGERINFNVTQKSAGCIFPDTVLVRNLETGNNMHQTGTYTVIAEHQHKKVQQEFRVVN